MFPWGLYLERESLSEGHGTARSARRLKTVD